MSDLLILENFTWTLLTLKIRKVNINEGAKEFLLFLIYEKTYYASSSFDFDIEDYTSFVQ